MKPIVTTLAAMALLAAACGGSKDATPAPATAPTGSDPYGAYYNNPQGAPQPGYPTQPGYAPQPGYPTQPGYAPQGTSGAPAPMPASTAPMAVPGPLALPCQADNACILARCNVQYQKCAFPCQSAADCATGASCNTASGLCLPGGQ